jgi:Trehalase
MVKDQLDVLDEAIAVLKKNDRKYWTVPAPNLYPHQWLWDSCFVAIGLRHLDTQRAKTELTSLLRGQWANGMLPNIIFASSKQYRRDRSIWRSWVSPYAPDKVATSGITQPPMLAEAIVRIGEKLKMPERRSWYAQMYPALLAYHQWLYRERSPHKEGLVILLHPYESGMDNSPVWISELRKHNMPLWIRAFEKLHLDGLVSLVRRDTRHVPPDQRMSNIEALGYWSALVRLRRKAYNSEAILSRSLFAVEDLGFNCILIRANDHLATIAKTIGKTVPEDLVESAKHTKEALDQLWDESTEQYFSRSFNSHKLIEEPTISTLLPLYSGTITQDRAKRLVELLKSNKWFESSYPVPSVPAVSDSFNPFKYWQGPSWVNINWLIIDGLSRYGFDAEATALRDSTVEMVTKSGCAEYFNPLTGDPAGTPDFSWTAALTIDLLKS